MHIIDQDDAKQPMLSDQQKQEEKDYGSKEAPIFRKMIPYSRSICSNEELESMYSFLTEYG